MNKWMGMGRLTADPEIRWSQGENPLCIARFRLAVDRKYKRDGEQEADFIPCVAFGKAAEFAEKYLKKGTKIAVVARVQTGSYTDNETGKKVYTTDFVIEEQEFAESKSSQEGRQQPAPSSGDDFMNVPDTLEEELPFN